MNSKKIVVYFSYTGNTRMIAEKIKDKTYCDILELKPVEPYSDDYDSVVNDEHNSEKSNYIPKIQEIDVDLSNYDEIILGTPVWWYRPVPVVRTFLMQNDLSGKTIKPFATNAGWPNAWAVFNLVKEVYAEEIINGNVDKGTTHGGMFGMGEKNTAFEKYFNKTSYLKPLAKTDNMFIANVTFEPKCRNNWHIHKATKDGGQILICVEGEGIYQEERKDPQSLKVGDVVTIPANVKHWHGAKDNWFSHIAIEVPGENTENVWCEPVTDEEYEKLL